ncbi:uroporphyrinogen decarboxylase family protein [Planctomycetota bacterium]
MNSKERVKAAIALEQPDMTPLGFYVVDHDTISNIIGRPTYLRNRPAMQKALWEGRRDEIVASMKEDLKDLYTEIDCVDLLTFKEAQIMPPAGYRPEDAPKEIADNTYESANGNIWKLDPTTNSIEVVHHGDRPDDLPTHTIEEFSDRTPPEEPDPSCFELSDFLVEEFGDERYIAGYSGGIVAVTMLGGMEHGLMTMALQPEVIKAANEQAVFRAQHADSFRIRPGTDGVLIEQDMAGTNGPMLSPDMFKELCYPYYRERIAQIKQHVDQVTLHNCGNNLPIMDMLVDGGIDAYESIQTNSAMSITALIDGYGDRLCVWGAVALEDLNTGTPEDARKTVQRSYEDAGDHPGFILGPSHSIAFGTKYDNFMAMLDEHVKLRDR